MLNATDPVYDAAFARLYGLLGDLRLATEDKDYNTQDAKFVREMIRHHEAAVEMAEKQIDKGKNAEVIALARAIKKAQKGEIDTMRQWLKDRDLSEDGDGGHGM